MFLTVTTLKDPSKMHSGHHTCEAFTFVGYDAFDAGPARTSGERTRRLPGPERGAILEDVPDAGKARARHQQARRLLEPGHAADQRALHQCHARQFVRHRQEHDQVGPGAFPIQTEIPGLYMVGASTLSHGVAGATSSGLAAARKILGCRTADLLTQNGPELRIYPSEDPGAWPAALQERIARGQEA